MALAEPVKKGGRYTQKEQEERKLQVHLLHFEENKSAVEIAEILNVNRNTINEDIKFWHNQLANKSGDLDIVSKMKKQIQRKEIQRSRFFDYLEEAETLNEKSRLEKQISDIDNNLTQFYSKIFFSGNKKLLALKKIEEVKEEEIKEFVRNKIFGDEESGKVNLYSENTLKLHYMMDVECSVGHAERAIQIMKENGLELCQDSIIIPGKNKHLKDNPIEYDLEIFGDIRKYISEEEIERINKKIENQIKENEQRSKINDFPRNNSKY